MIVKEKFVLLKNVPNTLNLSQAKLKKVSIPLGPRKVFVVLEMMKDKIDHFTKKRIINLVTDKTERKIIQVVNLPEYNLSISYNRPTDGIIININAFGTDDIYPTNPDPKNIYASLVYGICFRDMIKGKVKISQTYFAPD